MWNIVYYLSIAFALIVSAYYIYLWGFSLKSVIMVIALMICGYIMGQMVDRLWFGDNK